MADPAERPLPAIRVGTYMWRMEMAPDIKDVCFTRADATLRDLCAVVRAMDDEAQNAVLEAFMAERGYVLMSARWRKQLADRAARLESELADEQAKVERLEQELFQVAQEREAFRIICYAERGEQWAVELRDALLASAPRAANRPGKGRPEKLPSVLPDGALTKRGVACDGWIGIVRGPGVIRYRETALNNAREVDADDIDWSSAAPAEVAGERPGDEELQRAYGEPLHHLATRHDMDRHAARLRAVADYVLRWARENPSRLRKDGDARADVSSGPEHENGR